MGIFVWNKIQKKKKIFFLYTFDRLNSKLNVNFDSYSPEMRQSIRDRFDRSM